MKELLGAMPGALRFLSLALVLGGAALLAGGGARRLSESDRRRLHRLWMAAAFVACISGAVGILTRSQDLADMAPSGGAAWALVSRTHFGRTWLAGESAALLLLIVVIASRGGWMAAALSAAALVVPPLASHSFALDPSWLPLAAHEAHVLAVALWVGGLLTLLAIGEPPARTALALTFSRRAPFLVAVVVASGIALGLYHVGSWPRLLATPYGDLVLGKIAMLAGALAAAGWLRWRILPALGAAEASRARALLGRALAIELGFAATAVLLAAELTTTVPAAHDDVTHWWLPLRFSVLATWPEAWVPERVTGGIAVAALYALAVAGMARRGRLGRAALVGGLGLALGAVIGLPPLAVPAFPGTYWTPQVPYDVVSVTRGRGLYRDHCTGCHGLAGRGDGPLAASLPKRPANLTEPHTAYHTAGDMFWWLTYGIPQSKMPPYADVLSEDDRWDLINYLRAFASGYQARLLTPRISPGRPWLGSVDFNYTTAGGESGLLRDFRERSSVLLVLFTPGSSLARLAELRRAAPDFTAAGAEVLAVPVGRGVAAAGSLVPLRVITEEADDIVTTYSLFRRTFADPGNDRDDDSPAHLEVLIDRFGYIRARWRPDVDERGWGDLAALRSELLRLAAEPRILPPPDEHVH